MVFFLLGLRAGKKEEFNTGKKMRLDIIHKSAVYYYLYVINNKI